MSRVLVVDDDPTVREIVVSYLRAAGHDVDEAHDGDGALLRMAQQPADLVVLDVMMPGLDGLETCRRLRDTRDVPVVLLTALGAEEARIAGLELGADDYVVKPFSPRELTLRVGSILRRSALETPVETTSGAADAPGGPGTPGADGGRDGGMDPTGRVWRDGGLVVDPAARRAVLHDVPLALTAREFDLLTFLVAHPGRAFSRDDLLQQVWGWSIGDHSTVTVHVRRLREKVETDPTAPVRLVTVWGVGYRWDAAAVESA